MTLVSLSQIDNWSHVALPFIFNGCNYCDSCKASFYPAVIAVIAVPASFYGFNSCTGLFFRRRTLVGDGLIYLGPALVPRVHLVAFLSVFFILIGG